MHRFGLRVARVLSSASAESGALLPQLGELAARYMTAILGRQHDDQAHGTGHLAPRGGAGSASDLLPQRAGARTSPFSSGASCPRSITHLITRFPLRGPSGGTPYYLPAPMIVENELGHASPCCKIHGALVAWRLSGTPTLPSAGIGTADA